MMSVKFYNSHKRLDETEKTDSWFEVSQSNYQIEKEVLVPIKSFKCN